MHIVSGRTETAPHNHTGAQADRTTASEPEEKESSGEFHVGEDDTSLLFISHWPQSPMALPNSNCHKTHSNLMAGKREWEIFGQLYQ